MVLNPPYKEAKLVLKMGGAPTNIGMDMPWATIFPFAIFSNAESKDHEN
jgi:hypothetical protein